jgi:hypothetical protein
LLLAACGEAKPPSAEHVALAKACVADGGTAEQCECQAAKVDDLLKSGEISAEVLKAQVLQAQGKEDEADAIMAALPDNVRFEQPSRIAEAQLSCHPAG